MNSWKPRKLQKFNPVNLSLFTSMVSRALLKHMIIRKGAFLEEQCVLLWKLFRTSLITCTVATKINCTTNNYLKILDYKNYPNYGNLSLFLDKIKSEVQTITYANILMYSICTSCSLFCEMGSSSIRSCFAFS